MISSEVEKLQTNTDLRTLRMKRFTLFFMELKNLYTIFWYGIIILLFSDGEIRSLRIKDLEKVEF